MKKIEKVNLENSMDNYGARHLAGKLNEIIDAVNEISESLSKENWDEAIDCSKQTQEPERKEEEQKKCKYCGLPPM